MRKTISLLMMAALLLPGLTGCSAKAEQRTGEAEGYGGTLKVQVTLSGEDITKVKITVDPQDLEKATIKIAAEDLPQSESFRYVSDLSIDVWTEKNHVGSLNTNSVDIEVTFDPENLQEGFNELPVKVTALDEKINIIGGYTVVVEVPEGSLPNAQ